MASQQFWDKWLLVVGWVLSVFGLLLAFANQTWLFDIVFNRLVNAVFWPSNVAMESIEPFQAWIYGVLGATVSEYRSIRGQVSIYDISEKRKIWHAN